MSEWRDYADQVDVIVETKDDPLSEPQEVWAIRLHRPPADPEQFETDVQDIARDPQQRTYRPHVLTARRTSYSWGADAASWQALLEVAAHYADEALAGLISAKFVSWWDKSRSAEDAAHPVTKEAAQEKAEWAILLAYDKVSRGDLRVVFEEHDRHADSWTFEITAPGRHFTVTVGAIGGIPTAVNVRCHFDGAGR